MRTSSGILRDGDQFELDLFPGVPWRGHSPRGLTRVRSGLFLRPEPACHEVQTDSTQLDFWPGGSKATKRKRPPPAEGASLLLLLKSGRRSRSLAEKFRRRG